MADSLEFASKLIVLATASVGLVTAIIKLRKPPKD